MAISWRASTTWHVDNTTCELEDDWTLVIRTHTTVENRIYLSPFNGPVPGPIPPTVTEFQIIPPVDPSEGLPPVPPTYDPLDGGTYLDQDDEEPLPEYHPLTRENGVNTNVSVPENPTFTRAEYERTPVHVPSYSYFYSDDSEEDPSECESSAYSRISGPRVNVQSGTSSGSKRKASHEGSRSGKSMRM